MYFISKLCFTRLELYFATSGELLQLLVVAPGQTRKGSHFWFVLKLLFVSLHEFTAKRFGALKKNNSF